MGALILSAALISTAPAVSTAPAAVEPAATLIAVGDIRLDGPVGQAILESGPQAPTAGVMPWLKGDIVFGNLETAITQRGERAAKIFNFRSHPKRLKALCAAGFTVINLANNHVMDFGAKGLLDTLKALDKEGMARVGAGKDLEEARKPVFLEAGGVKVGLLGLTSTQPEFMWARRARPGVAYSDFDRFPYWIREAKRSCDVLVVSFHGGTERAEAPNEVQRAFGRAAVDAGADIVLGHHPHVLQSVELRNGKPILYSLGNFLFVSPTPSTRLRVIARITLSRGGVRGIDFVPVEIAEDGRLKPARAPADIEWVRRVLDRDGALSARPDFLRIVEDAP
jgi:poly-gamma-glutamate synthesis protein (capsule biosynthesis protein)